MRSLAFDVTNEWFCSGSADRTIKFWDFASGELKLTLTGLELFIYFDSVVKVFKVILGRSVVWLYRVDTLICFQWATISK